MERIWDKTVNMPTTAAQEKKAVSGGGGAPRHPFLYFSEEVSAAEIIGNNCLCSSPADTIWESGREKSSY